MAGDRIKLFESTQKNFQAIGIYPTSQFNHNHSRINSKIWAFLLCLTQFFISTVAYLMFEANSMFDYGMAFFTCTATVFAFISYLILFWQIENILKYIESCERFIEKSKLNSSE